MITVEHFGQDWGKLGNQLFQIGLLFGVKQRRGYDFYVPHNSEPVWDCFDLDIAADGPEYTHRFFEENGSCNFDPRVFEQPDGTAFHGYFQSYRYFDEWKAPFLQMLRFRFEHRARSEALLFTYRRRYRRPLVALHVRRGDYALPDAQDTWGNLARDGYYERAAELIGDGVVYLIFSDDIAWCRENLRFDCMEFMDFDHFTSLSLMTGCDVNVIANSTYSWWGAYLNPDADVYAPSPWFGPAMSPPNDRQDDIVPPSWRTIQVYAGQRSIPGSASR